MAKRIKPVSRIVRIETEINRIAGQVFLPKKTTFGWADNWVPCVDIYEKEDSVIVELELPGVRQEDISILLHGNRIEIKGQKKENMPLVNRRYLRLEREYGKFHRDIFLPSVVVPEKARATLENGVLAVTMTKFSLKKEKEIVLKIENPKE